MMNGQRDEQTLMRRFLLSDLDEAQQEQVEERLLSDEDFAERLSEAQDSLIDDYVFDALPVRERQRFENSFILTDERWKKIRFVQAIESYVGDDASSLHARHGRPRLTPSWWENSLQLVWSHKAWAILSLAVVLLVALFVLKALKSESNKTALLAQRATIEHQVAELNKRAVDDPQAPPMLELSLQPTLLREGSGMKKVTITDDVKMLGLKFELQTRQYESYRAQVQTADGTELFAIGALTPDAGLKSVLLKIPSIFLPTGDYQVLLSGVADDGRVVDAGHYFFRIINNTANR